MSIKRAEEFKYTGKTLYTVALPETVKLSIANLFKMLGFEVVSIICDSFKTELTHIRERKVRETKSELLTK